MSASHLTENQVERCRQHILMPQEILSVYTHIAECERCRNLVAAESMEEAEVSGHLLHSPGMNLLETVRLTTFENMRMNLLLEGSEPMHLWDEQIVDYVLDTMGPEEREVVEAHLQVCVECRTEALQIQNLAERSEGENMDYRPHPIRTAEIVLPADIVALTELLAENAHEIWSQQRISDGWRYGPQRNDVRKEHPGLVPYARLDEIEKEYDRCVAMETLKAILALGYHIEKKT